MKAAYGYCRVSSDGQAERGLSTEAQRKMIEGYVETYLAPKGYTLGGFFVDLATSGKTRMADRLQGGRLCTTVEKGDAVVMAKLDRGFRNVRDALTTMDAWTARGVTFHILDLQVDSSSPMGRMMLTLLAAFAEFERGRIGERMRETYAYRRAAGLTPPGKCTYGFKRAGPVGKRHYVRDDDQRALMARIVDWRAKGWSFDDIAWHLKAGRVTFRGKSCAWYQMKVIRLFAVEQELRRQEAAVPLAPGPVAAGTLAPLVKSAWKKGNGKAAGPGTSDAAPPPATAG